MKKFLTLAGTLVLSGVLALTAYAAEPEADYTAPYVNARAERMASLMDRAGTSSWADRIGENLDVDALFGEWSERADNFDRESLRGRFGARLIDEADFTEMRERRTGRFAESDMVDFEARFERFNHDPSAHIDGRMSRRGQGAFSREDVAARFEQFRENPAAAFSELFTRAEIIIAEIDLDEAVARFEQFRQNPALRTERRAGMDIDRDELEARVERFKQSTALALDEVLPHAERRSGAEINRDELRTHLEMFRQDPQSTIEDAIARFTESELAFEDIFELFLQRIHTSRD